MNKNLIKILLERLSERPVAFHPVYARVFGGINAALLIQQMHFWGDKGSREDGYIYKTKKCIQEETTLTARQQDIARRLLEKSGVLNTKILKVNGSPTVHYKVSVEILLRRIMEYYKMPETSITESTSESTKREVLSPKGDKNSYYKGKIIKNKDPKVVGIIEKFESLCQRNFNQVPLLGIEEYVRVKQLLARGITDVELYDLLDLWFRSDRCPEDIFSLRKALSNNEINTYRMRYLR